MNAHGSESLSEMIKIYAPKEENKTEHYLHFLQKKTGVKDARKIRDFSPVQFEKLWRAIELMEGNGRPTFSTIKKNG